MPLRFDCPQCSARLSASKDLYHTIANCPDCAGEFIVPTPDDIKLPTEQVKFVCPHCRRKLSAVPEQFGMRMPCPASDCGGRVDIPDPGWKVIPLSK